MSQKVKKKMRLNLQRCGRCGKFSSMEVYKNSDNAQTPNNF